MADFGDVFYPLLLEFSSVSGQFPKSEKLPNFTLLNNRKVKARFGVLCLLYRRHSGAVSFEFFSRLSRPGSLALSVVVLALLCCTHDVAKAANYDGDGNEGWFSWWNNWYGDTFPSFNYSTDLEFNYQNNSSQAGGITNNSGWLQAKNIVFQSTFPRGVTLASANTSNDGINFNQKIENYSSFTQTISMSLSGAKNGASLIELNPVNGDLTFTGNFYNDNSVDYVTYGGNGRTLTLSTTLGVGGTAANVDFTIKNSGSTVQVNNNQSWAGTTYVENGTFKTASGVTLATGTLNISGGTFTNAGANVLGDSSTVTMSSGAFNMGGSDTVGTFTITGGTLGGSSTLTATNGYNLNGGTINGNLGAGTANAASGSVSLNGTLGATTVNVSGGTLTLGASDRLSNSADVTVSSGTLSLGSYSDTINKLVVSGGTVSSSTGVLTSSNTYDMRSGSVSAILAGSSGLKKTTSGILTLSGVNTYTGTTLIEQGTINISADRNLGADPGSPTAGSITMSNTTGDLGALVATETFTLDSDRGLNLVGSPSGGQSSYFVSVASGKTLTYNGAITGAGNLVQNQAGTLKLGGTSSSYTGGIYIDMGTVEFSGGSIGSSAGSTYMGLGKDASADAAAFTISAADLTTSRNIEVRSGGTRKINYTPGSGTSTLSGNLTLSNSLAFNVATNGTLLFSGTVTPQASGDTRLAFDGGGTFISTGNSTTTAANYQVRVGNATLIIGSGALISRTGSTGIGHGYDLGVDLNNARVTNTSSILASNGVTVASSIYVSTANNAARVLGVSGTGTATFSGDVGLADAGLTVGGTNGLAIFSGKITNYSGTTANTLTKTGAGTVTLSGANTYGGTTTLSAGQLNINNASAISTGAFTISGGAIDNTSGAAITLANNNTQNWNGDFTFVGSTNLNLGTGAVTMNANRAVTISANELTVGGAIGGGAYSLTKSGAGTLTLSGNNTYSGTTYVNAGTLQATTIAAALGPTNGSLVLNGGNLQLANDSGLTFTKNVVLSNNATITLDRLTSGAAQNFVLGKLDIAGASTLTIARGANVTSNNARLTFGAVTLSGSGGVIAMGTTNTLLLSTMTGTDKSLTITNNNTVTVSGNISMGSGSLTKAGTGYLELQGSNNSTGAINLLDGSLLLRNSNALSLGTLMISNTAGSTTAIEALGGVTTNAQNNNMAWNGNFSFGLANTTNNFHLGTGSVTLGTNVVVSVKTYGLTVGGAINGAGWSLTKSNTGILTLAASNTYSGGTIIGASAGTLALSGSGALLSTGAVSNASTFDISGIDAASTTIGSLQGAGAVALGGKRLIFGDANNTTISGILSGAGGAITKQGNGTVTLSGANTFSGGTTLSAGTILIANAGSGVLGNITNSSVGTGTLALNGGRVSSDGTTARTIYNAVTVGAGVSLGDTTKTGALTFAGDVNLGGSTRNIAIDSAVTMSGAVSNGGITKNGSSTLTLSGANTFASGLILNLGGLNINNAGALGSGTFTINGGTFIDNTSGGAISNTANNTMSWAGNFTFTGSTNLDLGTGAVTLTGSRQVTVSGNALTVGGAIGGGAYALTKAGAGTLILGGANTYSSGTTISAGTLALSGAGSLLSTGAVTNSGTFDISGISAASTTIGSLQGAGAVALGGKRLIFGDANNTTISGIISGSGGAITKQGAGTVTLSGANTYSGGTLVSAGTLAGSTTSLQGNITNNAALIFDQSTNGTYAGVVSGSGSFAKTNSGIVTLTGANTFSGGTFINGGTLALSGSGSLLSTGAVVNNNVFDISAITPDSFTIGSLAGTNTSARLNLGSKTLVVGDANNTTYAGWLTNSGSLTKQGSGTLTLTGANTYTGKTTINGGTIAISAENNLGAAPGSPTADAITLNGGTLATTGSGTITLSSNRGVTLGASGGTIDVASGVSFGTTIASAVIVGSGGLTKTGAGTLSFNQSSNNTFTGDFVVNEGVVYAFSRGGLVFGATNTGSLVLNGGVVQLAGGAKDYGRSVVVNSNATFLIDRTDANPGVIQSLGGLTIGGQTLTVNGANSTSAGSANRLAFGGAVTVSGGAPTFVVNYDAATTNFAGLIFSNTVDNGGQLLTFAGNGNTEARGVVSGAGGILKQGTGTLILGAANTYTGDTAISNGAVLVAHTNALQSSTVELAASSTMKFTNALTAGNVGMIKGSGDFVLTNLGGNSVALTVGTNNGSGTYSGIMSGSGSLNKIGTGTFTLAGENTYTGTTTVSAGNLAVSGKIASTTTTVTNTGVLSGSGSIAGTTTIKGGGTISPGNSPGTISVTNLVFGTNGNYNWQLYDAAGVAGATNGYDWINGSGSLTISANATDKFNINLWTLSGIGPDTNGSAINFLSSSNYSWTLGTWTSISGFNTNYFSINTSATNGTGGFANAFTGTFSLTSSNNSIFLNYAGPSGPPVYAGGSGVWSTGFSPALTQGATDAYFTGTGGTATNDIASATVNTIGNLIFSNTAGSYTLTASNGAAGYDAASALAITGNIVNNSSSAQTINLALGFSNASTIDAAAGNMTFGGAISNGSSLTFAGASNNTVSGEISGAGSLIKTGSGTLTLADNNSYGGTTTISNGTLNIALLADAGSNSSIGTNGTVTMAGSNATNTVINYTGGNVTTDRNFVFNGTATNGEGGTITMSSSNTVVTLDGSASGAGKMIVGEGTLVLANTGATNQFAPGAIQVDSGATLVLAAANQIGDSTGLILNGGTFLVGASTLTETLGTLTLSASSTIDLGAFGASGDRNITFANSSGITWNTNAILTIANWQGSRLTPSQFSSIYFGSTNGLTASQLSQIRFDGYPDYWYGELVNPGGELVPVPEPRVYAAAIALVAAIGWSERKRLRKFLGNFRK